MTSFLEIAEIVRAWNAPKQVGEYIVVPTYSVYPSNSLVQAYISGSKGSFVVSDGGGAVSTLLGAGARTGAPRKLLNDFSRGNCVKVNSEGWIYQGAVPLGGIADAISSVSETSVNAARFLLRRFQPEPIVDFRHDLETSLRHAFLSAMHKRGHLIGASNKTHTFDYLINANDNITIALDAVVRDSSSINAAVVAHMDIKATNRTDVRQYIVYDDAEEWSAADIALLTIGAPAVAYSRFYRSVVQRHVA